jgi:hypothetical protein
LRNVANATLVDGTCADIGCCPGKSDTESPAANCNFFSALFGTFLELSLASRSGFALVVLGSAFSLNALSEFLRLGEDKGDKKKHDKEDFHLL